MVWSVGVAVAISLLNTSQQSRYSTVHYVYPGSSSKPPSLDLATGIQGLVYGTGIAFAGFALVNKRFFKSPGMMLLVFIGTGALLDPMVSLVAHLIIRSTTNPGDRVSLFCGKSLWDLHVHLGYLILSILAAFFFVRGRVAWLTWKITFLAFGICFFLVSDCFVDFFALSRWLSVRLGGDYLFLACWSIPCSLTCVSLALDFIRRREIDWWTCVATSVLAVAMIGMATSIF